MKFAIVFLALVGYAYGGYVEGLVGHAVGVVNTGASAQFRSQDVSDSTRNCSENQLCFRLSNLCAITL